MSPSQTRHGFYSSVELECEKRPRETIGLAWCCESCDDPVIMYMFLFTRTSNESREFVLIGINIPHVPLYFDNVHVSAHLAISLTLYKKEKRKKKHNIHV